MDVMEELTAVFREVFNYSGIVLSDRTTAEEIEGWDSLAHATLVLAVESHFKIRFSQRELLRFATVGDMRESIQQKITKK